MRYDAKISIIEYSPELEKITVDHLHGICIAYEMRTWSEKTSKGETTFKESKTKMRQEKKANDELLDISDEEIELHEKTQERDWEIQRKYSSNMFQLWKNWTLFQ
jgi:D-hexose-6-phosphate mutarotase